MELNDVLPSDTSLVTVKLPPVMLISPESALPLVETLLTLELPEA